MSKHFTVNNMKKKIGLNGYVFHFSVDYIIDISDINIHIILMKMHDIMFRLVKKCLLDY